MFVAVLSSSPVPRYQRSRVLWIPKTVVVSVLSHGLTWMIWGYPPFHFRKPPFLKDDGDDDDDGVS